MKRALVLATIITMLAALMATTATVVQADAHFTTTIVVNTTEDLATGSDFDKHTCSLTVSTFIFPAGDGKCTLRRAVLEAGSLPASAQPILISFAIPTDGSDAGWDSTLMLAEVEINGSHAWELDDVKNVNGGLFTPSNVTIDGSTQPSGRTTGPKIMIDTNRDNGALFGSSLQIRGDGHTIENLGFHGGGEVILSHDGNTVQNIWMGLSNDGLSVELASTASSQAMRSVARGGISLDGSNNTITGNRIVGAFGRAIRARNFGTSNNTITDNFIGMNALGETPSTIDCIRSSDYISGQWYGGRGILSVSSDSTITGNRLAHLHMPISTIETPPIAFEIDGSNNTVNNNIVGIDAKGQMVGTCGQGILLGGNGTEVTDNTLYFTRNGFTPTDIGKDLDSAILIQSISGGAGHLKVWNNIIDGGDKAAATYHANRFSNVNDSLLKFTPANVTSISGTAVSGTNGIPVDPSVFSDCPNCTIFLYLDDLDDRIESKELLGTATADASGNWSTTLSRALTATESLRTQSMANSTGIFSPYGANQTSELSDIFFPSALADATPPVVTFPDVVTFDVAEPQSVSGTVSDAGSGVDRVEIIALDLGAAGATGTTGLLAWTDLMAWGQVSDAPILQADVNGGNWSFMWNPIPGGSGSYVLGVRAFDNAGNKWPADKPWQALIRISDASAPTVVANTPAIAGNKITWTGEASDDVAVRKVRLIIRDVVANEYWNGTVWVPSAQAGADPSVLLQAELSSPLVGNPTWTYSLETTRTGTFQTLHWAQNGAYSYNRDSPPVSQIALKPG